ncbi:MAG: DUF1501 domain-containing protein [Planctomycetes bacterium]|nr:DUF1501 domain-containing protein [Planctomycetota bacterium]
MFGIGNLWVRDCGGISRRSFLRAGAALPLMYGVPRLIEPTANAQEPRARSILVFWLGGGPSHRDLFDPKPKAPAEYRGPFSTIATKIPGVRFTELLPRLAARSDRFSLVRTNVNFDGDHLIAGSMALTGAAAGQREYPPNFGSIVARRRGSSDLPPFVSLARGPIGDGRGPLLGHGGGTWGAAYDPFMLSCSEQGEVDVPGLKLLDGLTPQRLSDRRYVVETLDHIRQRTDNARFEQWDKLSRDAYTLLTSPDGRKAFDLSREPSGVREAYGYTSVGQSGLLGRRLVEAGVPYVQVNWSQYVEVFYQFSDYGWDTHADNFGLLADWHGPLLDRVLSTLLDDLEVRGLLETTLVVCMGEFGRTPRINPIGSRDHWHQCYFSIWAGGGVQPGRVVGSSDPRGEFPATRPVTPAMVGTTMLELAGVKSAARAELQVLPGGSVIEELL